MLPISLVRNFATTRLIAQHTINGVASIGSIEGRREVVAELQSVDSLTHAIKVVVLRQLGDEFNELVLVDQHATPGIVKNISSRFAHNREGEAGIVAPAELKIDVFRLRLWDTLLRQVDEVRRQDVMSNVVAV